MLWVCKFRREQDVVGRFTRPSSNCRSQLCVHSRTQGRSTARTGTHWHMHSHCMQVIAANQLNCMTALQEETWGHSQKTHPWCKESGWRCSSRELGQKHGTEPCSMFFSFVTIFFSASACSRSRVSPVMGLVCRVGLFRHLVSAEPTDHSIQKYSGHCWLERHLQQLAAHICYSSGVQCTCFSAPLLNIS